MFSFQRREIGLLNIQASSAQRHFFLPQIEARQKHRQWILIGQSFLKTIRTIEDKIIPSRGGEKRTRPRGKGPKSHGRFWAPWTVIGGAYFCYCAYRSAHLEILGFPMGDAY